jgi:hypothetical protein
VKYQILTRKVSIILLFTQDLSNEKYHRQEARNADESLLQNLQERHFNGNINIVVKTISKFKLVKRVLEIRTALNCLKIIFS